MAKYILITSVALSQGAVWKVQKAVQQHLVLAPAQPACPLWGEEDAVVSQRGLQQKVHSSLQLGESCPGRPWGQEAFQLCLCWLWEELRHEGKPAPQSDHADCVLIAPFLCLELFSIEETSGIGAEWGSDYPELLKISKIFLFFLSCTDSAPVTFIICGWWKILQMGKNWFKNWNGLHG